MSPQLTADSLGPVHAIQDHHYCCCRQHYLQACTFVCHMTRMVHQNTTCGPVSRVQNHLQIRWIYLRWLICGGWLPYNLLFEAGTRCTDFGYPHTHPAALSALHEVNIHKEAACVSMHWKMRRRPEAVAGP